MTQHISPSQEASVVNILKAWRQRPVTWALLQVQLESRLDLNGEPAWSRQSLSSKVAIAKAFENAKKRVARRNASQATGAFDLEDETQLELSTLQRKLDEAVQRYEDLLLRHHALLSAAALLPGGANLMIEP